MAGQKNESIYIQTWRRFGVTESIDNDRFIIKNGCLLVSAGLHQTYPQRLLAMHQQAKKMEAQAR
jgi:hypothetical protein